MTAQTVKEFGPVTALNATSKDAVAQLVKAWESKNAQRAARGAGLGLMAVSLAACGGGEDAASSIDDQTGVIDSQKDTDGDGVIDSLDLFPRDPALSGAQKALTSALDLIDPKGLPLVVTGGNGTLTSGDVINATSVVLDLNKVDIDGQTIKASVVTIDASNGVSIEASDWTVSTVRIADSRGNVSVLDLQSTSTALVIDDMVDAAATVTFDFDAQALTGASTVSLSLAEVTSAVALTGGAIETVNIAIADKSADADSSLAGFTATGITTLNIAGGAAGYDFKINAPLDAGITTLNASTVASNLTLDVTASTTAITATMGSGNDSLNMGNTYHSNDKIDGGAGASDQVTMAFTSAETREGTMAGFETLNASFSAAATFDATNVTGLETINLSTSTADADFNDMKSETTMLNIDGTVLDVEMDYITDGNLTINLNTTAAAVSVGDTVADDIQLHDVDLLSINVNGGNTATIGAETNLHDDTTSLTITTDTVGGNLTMNGAVTAIAGGDALETVDVIAVHGDMSLGMNPARVNPLDSFINSVAALQTYNVSAFDADVVIGQIGNVVAAVELESLGFVTDQDGTIDQGNVLATGANIETVTVETNDKNTVGSVQTFFNVAPAAFVATTVGTATATVAAALNANIVVRGLEALQIDNVVLRALDGGHIVLDDQAYQVAAQTFVGSGNIYIQADNGQGTPAVGGLAYVQSAAADASGHTGLRVFQDGTGADTFFGSTADDLVIINSVDRDTDSYVDAGGNDVIAINGGAQTTTSVVGYETVVTLADASSNTVFVGFGATPAASSADITINSAGTQTISIATGQNSAAIVIGDNVLNGSDTVREFVISGFGVGDTIDFRGLGLLSATAGDQTVAIDTVALNTLGKTVVNANSVVLLNDAGGVNISEGADNESLATTGTQKIADFSDLQDVAAWLDEGLAVTGNNVNVFVIKDEAGSLGNDAPDDTFHVYYFDDANGSGIEAGELDYIGSITGAVTFTEILTGTEV